MEKNKSTTTQCLVQMVCMDQKIYLSDSMKHLTQQSRLYSSSFPFVQTFSILIFRPGPWCQKNNSTQMSRIDLMILLDLIGITRILIKAQGLSSLSFYTD